MPKYVIAIDAMGGDDVPAIPVEAGVIAAQEHGACYQSKIGGN